ncbi:sarcosine oxidase subunit gamma [Ruegeria sp.]|uniref:sarcosine oxidase subunit gamma n=1 Tax=Ruegeria sp. TaxID=1879320 RepID=UPI003C7B7938
MSYDVDIARTGMAALFDLKGVPEPLEAWLIGTMPALPRRPNSKFSGDGVDLLYIGPNHWLIRAPLDQEQSLSDRLKPETCPPDISIVRVSDTQVFFRVVGPQASDIMAIACPLDLHLASFGPQDVTFTEIFGLKALVQRCEGGFEFAVEQSFADMVEDYLSRANA